MSTYLITKVKIDDLERLLIFVKGTSYSLIWRSATGVNWDKQLNALYSEKPREWSYLMWFNHIRAVVKAECSDDLQISGETLFENIPDNLHSEILKTQDDSNLN